MLQSLSSIMKFVISNDTNKKNSRKPADYEFPTIKGEINRENDDFDLPNNYNIAFLRIGGISFLHDFIDQNDLEYGFEIKDTLRNNKHAFLCFYFTNRTIPTKLIEVDFYSINLIELGAWDDYNLESVHRLKIDKRKSLRTNKDLIRALFSKYNLKETRQSKQRKQTKNQTQRKKTPEKATKGPTKQRKLNY